MPPKKVDILGLKVFVKEAINLTLEENPLVSLAGLFDWEKKSITINASLSKDEKMHTLLHEIIHAVFRRSGLGQCNISPEVEEIIAEVIPTVICENFRLTLK